MHFKAHIIRTENFRTIMALATAKIDHKVIAMFMTSEGVPLQAHEVSALINSFNALGGKKIPSKKVRTLIQAKQMGEDDESLPCPV